MHSFRKYHPSDREDLVKLFLSNVPAFFAQNELQDFINYLQEHPENYYLLLHHGVVIGAGGFYFKEKENEIRISWTMIHPSYHKMGQGRSLIEYCMKEARDRYPAVSFIVHTSQHAKDFYARLGFEVEHTEKNHWAPNLDLYIMRKENTGNISDA